MSVLLANALESFLRNKAVIGTYDYQHSCEHSLRTGAGIEPQRLVSEELHSSLVPLCSTECQSESGEQVQCLQGLQFPVWSRGPSKAFCKEQQPWNNSNSTPESAKIGSEESESDSEKSDSSVEELETNFSSQICISADNHVQRVQDDNVEECKGIETQNCVNNNPLTEQGIPVSATLVGVAPFSANKSKENLQNNGLRKSLLSSQSCLVGFTKLRSALRGSYKDSGLGPRPILHVSWAPDVYEPACTSVSHTVSSKHRRHHAKKDHKHRHKGKSSLSDSRKKVAKKASPKSRHIGEPFVLRSGAFTPQNEKCSLREVGLKDNRVLPCNEHSLKSVRLNSTVLPQNFCVNGMVQLGERRLAKLDVKLPFSWQVQSHRLVI